MIEHFMCDNCTHYLVCEKLKPLMKFHESAKKDLMITLTMNDCADFVDENDGAKQNDGEDDE